MDIVTRIENENLDDRIGQTLRLIFGDRAYMVDYYIGMVDAYLEMSMYRGILSGHDFCEINVKECFRGE